jgi:hypothetical protein
VGQTRLLARTFFARLFESDLMPEGLPQVQLMLWSVLLAATPTTGLPLMFAEKYQFDQFFKPLGPEIAADRVLLITLSMIAIGVVGLYIWDGVFPDRRDVRILGPLPIPGRRFVIARLIALGRVYVLFATAICVPQSVMFSMVATGFGHPVSRVFGSVTHLATVVCASVFVFCSLIAMQCLLLLLFGRRAAQHVSVAFQMVFAVGLVQLIFFLPELGRVLRQGGGSHEGISALGALPPTWFFGLYEALSGIGDATAVSFARLAVIVTLAAAVLAVGLYASTYGRLTRRALEGPPPASGRLSQRRIPAAIRAASRRRFDSPLTSAIRQFTMRTLARSRSHRMMFAVYGGVALAIVISSAVSVAFQNNGAGLWRPGLGMLSMPLVFQFLLLVAIRVIVAVPSEPKARWVFRACEPADRSAAISGTRDTMMILVVFPTVGFALLQGLIFWNIPAALSHAVFCWVAGRFLAEILIARTGKLPFACTYFPGKSRVFTLWPVYLILFFVYSVAFAEVDRVLLTRPTGLIVFCVVAILATGLLAFLRRRALAALPGLRFEEEDPDAIFEGFHLSEGLAAAPKPTHLDTVPNRSIP